MEKLFSYGTLQMENVQWETFGRLLTGCKDILPGYVLAEITINDATVIARSGTDKHPILQFTGNAADEVAGTVFEITPAELQQADAYEVADYARTQARFKSGNTAWVYVAAAQT